MEKQQRNTKQRRMVLEAVQKNRNHPNADQIYLDVRKENAKISRGTVYRNLRFLADIGEIHQVDIPGADRFDWRLEEHYHLVCTQCGKVIDAPLPYQQDLDLQITQASGYKMLAHNTVFQGICPQCNRKQKTQEDEMTW